MADIIVRFKGLERAQALLDPKKVDRAIVQSINRVAKSTRTESSRIVRNEKGWRIRKRDFDKRIVMYPAFSGKPEARLWARRVSGWTGHLTNRDSFALPYFGAKEIKKTRGGVVTTYRSTDGGLATAAKRQKRSKHAGGVRVKVQKGGKAAFYPGAFIAQMRSKHIGVFRRVTSGKDKGKIREVKTISVGTMFRQIKPRLIEHARKRWDKEFPAALRHQMKMGR